MFEDVEDEVVDDGSDNLKEGVCRIDGDDKGRDDGFDDDCCDIPGGDDGRDSDSNGRDGDDDGLDSDDDGCDGDDDDGLDGDDNGRDGDNDDWSRGFEDDGRFIVVSLTDGIDDADGGFDDDTIADIGLDIDDNGRDVGGTVVLDDKSKSKLTFHNRRIALQQRTNNELSTTTTSNDRSKNAVPSTSTTIINDELIDNELDDPATALRKQMDLFRSEYGGSLRAKPLLSTLPPRSYSSSSIDGNDNGSSSRRIHDDQMQESAVYQTQHGAMAAHLSKLVRLAEQAISGNI